MVKGQQTLRAAASSELCSLVRNLDGEPSISGAGAEPVRLWRRPVEAMKQQSGAVVSDRRGTEGGTKRTDKQIKLGTLSGTSKWEGKARRLIHKSAGIPERRR